MILVIRTDNPEAEIGLFDHDGAELTYNKWHAHRELEATLLETIEDQINSQDKTFQDITGIIVYAGPGSFTGLRIGFTVVNTLAATLGVPNVKADGEDWIKKGIVQLEKPVEAQILLPDYGGEANITKPKK